ncbi:MAG: D-alanyl-D-alanine carboxypeptidase family protein [Clostridia bacterium]|nr:D-alanyl-D-alanine carboxypeptidase family protein [Clostridia bacterium]
MNNTPENNNRSYQDYHLNGTSARPQGQFRAERTPSRQPAGQPSSGAQMNRQPQQNTVQRQRPAPLPQSQPQSQPRRPLNDEERRRLEAARMVQNGGRSAEEEFRRRRQEQQILGAAQPQANPQRRVQIVNPGVPQNRQQTAAQTRARKKKSIRINVGAVLFVLLIAGVIGVSMHQIQKNEEAPDLPDSNLTAGIGDSTENTDFLPDEETLPEEILPEGTETPDSAENPDASGTETADSQPQETPADVNLTLYDTVTVSNATLDEGDLILVNYEHSYADTDTISLANVYNQRTSGVKVSSTAINLTGETLKALDNLLFGLTADTGNNDLIIVSGHRTVAEQQKIYDDYVVSNGPEYAKAYVADAGYSEHHTGLACDLSFFTDDGYMIPIADHDFGYWIGDNCMKYGFIRRYPEDKVDITKIAYEAWHFRYIGIPHAYACTALGLCLEEYIAELKNYTAETRLLHIKPDGTAVPVELSALPVEGSGWLTYYAPMTEGENTEIKLLRGEAYRNYELSGNNADGYIVTVTLD